MTTTTAAPWVRYRFQTRSVDDYRPLVWKPAYPWWCSGEAGDGSTATIIAYLPAGEPLTTYWDDAEDVEQEPADEVVFTSRSPKSKNFVETPGLPWRVAN